MWALRRASNPLKNWSSSIGISRLCCAGSEIVSSLADRAEISEPYHPLFEGCVSLKKCYHATFMHSNCCTWKHGFSSQAGAKSTGEEDNLEDGFSELEMSASADVAQESDAENENEDELISEPEFVEDDEEESENLEEPTNNELELSDAEVHVNEKKSESKRVRTALLKTVLAAPNQEIHTTLDKWADDKDLSRGEIMLAINNLRKRRMFVKAVQLSEWLEKSKKLDFAESDYACRLSLIAKARGLHMAENYIEKIPQSFRGEIIYQTHLANCVAAKNVKKTEETFNKMKDLGFPLTCSACNQLLLLYKVVDKKKIGDVLLLMEKENIKPSLLTYRVLIDTKGQSNDITGMDQIIETMKAEAIEPDIETQSIIAKHYLSGGLKDKAEAILKEMEGGSMANNPWACSALLPLYATLGKANEVARLWKACESKPRLDQCMAAIEAWGKLKKINEAEAVFNKMTKTWKISSKHYCALLKVYADNKMLAKGKDLVKQMADSECRIGPLTWDLLVKLYLEAGEVGKADSILQKVAQQNQIRPMFTSYVAIMDQYAKRGDVHNSEKMLHRLKLAGYMPRLPQFQTLIQAYINAKAPAYGIRDRMKADNIYPNRALAAQLPLVDAFRKTAVSDLFD